RRNPDRAGRDDAAALLRLPKPGLRGTRDRARDLAGKLEEWIAWLQHPGDGDRGDPDRLDSDEPGAVRLAAGGAARCDPGGRRHPDRSPQRTFPSTRLIIRG